MKRFDQYMQHFADLDGWFQTPAIAIWDSLLSYQQEQRITGNLLEIGVWKGKSAALAALHCEGEDACVFVDALPLDEAKARISKVVPATTCHYLQEQSQFLARHPFVAQGPRAFRWIHVDGEHSAQSVINDLEIVDHLLSDRGVAVFDDFFSPGYPQVTQAVFQFMSASPGRLALVLSVQAKSGARVSYVRARLALFQHGRARLRQRNHLEDNRAWRYEHFRHYREIPGIQLPRSGLGSEHHQHLNCGTDSRLPTCLPNRARLICQPVRALPRR